MSFYFILYNVLILLYATYVLRYLWVDDQISDHTMFLQVGVSFLSFPIFHLIGTIQVLQCHWCNVDSPGNEQFNQYMVLYEYQNGYSGVIKITLFYSANGNRCFFQFTHPGTPPASIWLARVTSCDQTSYCHFWSPITPHRTFPECTPTRMLMSTPVASRTFLSCNKRQFLYILC